MALVWEEEKDWKRYHHWMYHFRDPFCVSHEYYQLWHLTAVHQGLHGSPDCDNYIRARVKMDPEGVWEADNLSSSKVYISGAEGVRVRVRGRYSNNFRFTLSSTQIPSTPRKNWWGAWERCLTAVWRMQHQSQWTTKNWKPVKCLPGVCCWWWVNSQWYSRAIADGWLPSLPSWLDWRDVVCRCGFCSMLPVSLSLECVVISEVCFPSPAL